jgi:hypothetical protein
MRARLYLYGDGDARNTHMSIFLVLLKGEHDAILPWPFNFPVTFCLRDQTGKNHHIDSLEPDPTLTNFQQPCTEMNIAGGIPKFCPLTFIAQERSCYVRDDTMYIKIRVDFEQTPKDLLPYKLSFNDELPVYLQVANCREEIERREQLQAALIEIINHNEQELSQLGLIPMYPLLQSSIEQADD